MRIEELSLTEVESIVPLAKEMLIEIGDKKPLNETFFVGTVRIAIDRDSGAVWVARDEKGICGVFMALSFPSIFTGKLMASLLFGYIVPEHRGKLGIRMFREFDDWAAARKAETSIAGINHAMPEGNAKIYAGMGYMPIETMWVREK